MGLLDADQGSRTPAVETGRLVWAGPLTVATSIAAVHVVRQAVIRLPHVRTGSVAFGAIAVTADTAVLCTIAVIVFGLVSAFHDDAIRRFRWIAFGALLVSLLPLVAAPEIGNLATVLGVAAMHVAAYTAKAVRMTVLYQGLHTLPPSWTAELARALPPSQLTRLRTSLVQLHGGDDLWVIYDPGHGTSVFHDDRKILFKTGPRS